MRRDAVFRVMVHLVGSYLDFEGDAVDHDCSVKGLVHVAFRRCNVVVELAGNGHPQRVDNSENRIAGSYVGHENPDSKNVVQVLEGELFPLHLLVNAVVMLRAALYPARNVLMLEPILENILSVGYDFLHFGETFFYAPHKLMINAGLKVHERQVLKFALNVIDAELMCQRSVNLHCLEGYPLLFVGAHNV